MSQVQSSTTPAATEIGYDQAIRERLSQFAAAWNKHDPRQMASFWAQEGDLISPFGRPAKGRLQVEQLFAEEQQGPMKQSTHQMTVTGVRLLTSDLALVDADCNITGMCGADGKEMPAFKPHVFFVMDKKSGTWSILAARPYAFAPKPDAAK